MMGGSNIPEGVWPVLLTPFDERGELDAGTLDGMLDFYMAAGVAGIFSAALSGEVDCLTIDEICRMNRRLVARADGRLPIVSGANIGRNLREQCDAMRRVHDTGVDAVIVLLSYLPAGQDLVGQLLELADMTPFPLGLYECPEPEHRLLSPEAVGTLAKTGRFFFMKETSRDAAVHLEKVAATRGTALKVFQGSLGPLPASLRGGSPGFCGLVANVCPELVRAYCDLSDWDTPAADALFQSISELQGVMTARGYPSSAKYILRKRGVKMGFTSRAASGGSFAAEDRAKIDRFLATFEFGAPGIGEQETEEMLTAAAGG